MKRKTIDTITKALPHFFRNASDYLKSNFDENGQKILENTSGTAGVIIRLFAQPLLDKYFNNLTERKLENFGFNIYLKSSLIQANASLHEIKAKLDDTLTPDIIFSILDKSIKEELTDFNANDIVLIFQPKYHPVIEYVKKNYINILREINTNPTDIKVFIKHFNENIESTVIREFGDDYQQHLKRTEKYRLKDNETAFLWDTVSLGRIGFKESENLKYEITYAYWNRVSNLREKNGQKEIAVNEESFDFDENENFVKQEEKLKPIEELIEEYFNRSPSNHLEEILFIVADFGKGKSVFMKHYAADLALKYLQTGEGYFPVYFNLRNFKNYSCEPSLGIISDYLETNYSIKLSDEYFQKKKYFFLIDSLDESGELNKQSIDKVISSIKNIQGINKSLYKTNRIIITSRPFDEGLFNHLNDHKPYIIKNSETRDIPYFINAYGFTKAQFNEWLFDTLKSFHGIERIQATGFAEQIIKAIQKNQKIDIYEELIKNKTLSRSELRRPIFAYMIYQLIINNLDFLEVGKIGVYLSFLNLLTKEAKHIHDINYKVNLREEFEFRNVLHSTASLWMYERQKGKQSALRKADICRVLEGKNCGESDNEILERFKGQDILEIQFLSHSYFGENDNILHFQHQSFAEILLAEYYLKVFIKYALDEDADLDEARVKLVLGKPTEQTVLFLKELFQLLRETSENKTSQSIIEKRKLLFPLMASISTKKHNRLFCNDIFYAWYKNCDIKENQTEYPKESLKNWCIDQKKLNKIIELASSILNSKTNYILLQPNSKTALFNAEVLEVQNQPISSLPSNIDRWLALLAGNLLYNDFSNKENPKLFNWDNKINNYNLFDMIRSWNYSYNESGPYWGKDLFIGINMQINNSELDLSHFNFDGIDFSYSFFKNIRCWGANWSRCTLNHCVFSDAHFITSLFIGASVNNIKKIEESFYMSNCDLNTSGFKLLGSLNFLNMKNNEIYSGHEKKSKTLIRSLDLEPDFDIFKMISGFLIYALQNSFITINVIKRWFEFESEEDKKLFNDKINSLKEYEGNNKMGKQ